ncbi:hypothetical protein D3C72_1852830 [compost metagenome]
MREAVEVEVGRQLRVRAPQQVEVERRRHALRVVVGRMQPVGVFHEVDADQQAAAAQHARRELQERQRLVGLEVADGRTGEEAHAPARPGHGRGQHERHGVVGRDGLHGQGRGVGFQARRRGFEVLARDVDRQIALG